MPDERNGATESTSPSADDFLAALGNMPLVQPNDLLDILDEGRDKYLVSTLDALPDNGGGIGTANLYRIPADTDRGHTATWAAVVTYDDNPYDVQDFGIFATKAEALNWHTQRIDERLANGCPVPTVEPER